MLAEVATHQLHIIIMQTGTKLLMDCFGAAAYQNAVREQKLAAEVSAAKRERDFYMGQVDKAKGMEAMAERKRKVSYSIVATSIGFR